MSSKQPVRATASTAQSKQQPQQPAKPASQAPPAQKPTANKPAVQPQSNGFDPSKYVRAGLSADDVQKIKDCFDIFDYDKSGAITPNELKNAIVALGLDKSADEILKLIEDLDTDGDNEVEFEEFLSIFGFTGEITDEDVLKDLFSQFDEQNRGLISVGDFQRINDLVGERYSESELQEMVEYADKDKDGFINWDEFQSVVLKQYGQQQA